MFKWGGKLSIKASIPTTVVLLSYLSAYRISLFNIPSILYCTVNLLRNRIFSYSAALLASYVDKMDESAPEINVNTITPQIMRIEMKMRSGVVLADWSP